MYYSELRRVSIISKRFDKNCRQQPLMSIFKHLLGEMKSLDRFYISSSRHSLSVRMVSVCVINNFWSRFNL
jgi:hypothetical protein